MIPVARLGFAIRKLLFSVAGLEIPEEVPSALVAAEFQTALGEVDVAMSGRTDLTALLDYADTTTPDTTTQELIARLRADANIAV